MREVCLKKLNLHLSLQEPTYYYSGDLCLMDSSGDCSMFEAGWGRRGVLHYNGTVLLRGKFASANLISMEFLHLFLRCHFAGKPLVASQQPHSQGSLLPALSLRRAGRGEPLEQGWRREMLAVFSA